MQENKNKILIVDDEEDILFTLRYLFGEEYEVFTTSKSTEAYDIVRDKEIHVLITDQKMAGLDGVSLLKQIRENFPQVIRILMTGYSEMDVAVSAINDGDVFRYVSKPWKPEDFKQIVDTACSKYNEMLQKEAKLQNLESKTHIQELMGPSEAVKYIAQQINKVSSTLFTVLIHGESGTGKEVLCRAIQELSDRKAARLVSVNCAAIPENLIESELFGYEKGAFTGAQNRKIGLIESAQGGTFFLDEISELPYSMQTKLLRVLQERKIRRVGGTEDILIDVRFIAATNKDLLQMVKEKKFRTDLFYRIAEYTIYIPPIRERKSDILFLTEKIVGEANAELDKNVSISEQALKHLLHYDWPGNVRELRNVIRKAVLLSDNYILPAHLDMVLDQDEVLECSSGEAGGRIGEMVKGILSEGKSLKQVLDGYMEQLEREVLDQVLRACEGNKSKASKALQVDYKTMYNKIRKYDL